MALPIKETPILEGKQAEEFFSEAIENENKRISIEELNRMKKNYDRFIVVNR